MRAVEQNNDLLIAPMDSLAASRPLVATWANESSPAVSPSGAWLAYVSDESGQVEIYLRPIPGPGPRVQLSANGGAEPRWDARGRAVYYRGPSRMMVVELGGTPPVVVRRDSLFLDAYERPGNVNHQNWDLFSNGTEFMMIRAREAELLTLVVNWQQWRAYTPAVRP